MQQDITKSIGKNFLPMSIQLTDEKKRKTRLKKNVTNWDGKLHDHNPKDYYNFIYTLLSNYGLMNEDDIEKILDEEGMKIMRSAVTHWSLQEELDYEVWETLGDTTLNKIMVWYMFRRFPHATSEELTEAKKLNVSKGQFPIYAHTIHLPQYVRYRNIQYLHGKNILTITLDRSIKEDTFEAFFGALEYLIDGKIMLGAGYIVCYNIVSHILDQQQMTIQLSKIKDSITQLKEIFDNRKKLGDSFEYTFDYANRKEIVTLRFNKENPSPCINHPQKPHAVKLEIKDVQGEKDGQRKASEQALIFLKKFCNIDWQSTTQK
jgi:dsRNA-specific ribonuclease